MDVVSINEYIESTFADIHIVTAWGETVDFHLKLSHFRG